MIVVLLAAVSSYCSTPHDVPDRPAGPSQAAHYRSLADDDAGARAPTRLRPANHTVDWLARHGAVARANADNCMQCHQEEDCQSCHTENLAKPFAVHPPNYEIIHATDARLNQANCSDCHNVNTFCASCHARTRVSATAPDRPPAREQFHPANWLDSNNPNNHGVVARRNIIECASCHQEQDCIRCHAGIDPHPPEFRMNCRRWLDANPQPCAKCHGDLQKLKGMCM